MSVPATVAQPASQAPLLFLRRGFYSQEAAAEWLGISEREVQRLVFLGILRTVKFGRLTRIPAGQLASLYRAKLAEAGIEDEEEETTEYEPKKEALPLARKRTQTRNLRSSAKNKSEHGHP